MALAVVPFVPKGLYQIGNFASPNLHLEQSGNIATKNDFDEDQQWMVSPAPQGGGRYDISNLRTSQALRVKSTLETTDNPISWCIDTQFGGLIIGVADDHNERVITLTARENHSALWPISGRKDQRWIFNSAIPGWIRTHSDIDTSKLYYIKNRTTGRFWCYVGDGRTGNVVCDQSIRPGAAYFQWKLSIESEDKGMLIATAHGDCPKATKLLRADSHGDSFRFMPVPGDKGWYFIGLGLNDNPPKVATGQINNEDLTKPGSIVPLAIDNQCQMWQLIDTAGYQ